VNSRTTSDFWKRFAKLPGDIQSLAREKHMLWLREPFHSSLQFKQVHPGLWSARINLQYRVLARRRGDLVVWFWIGTHNEYDRLIQGN